MASTELPEPVRRFAEKYPDVWASFNALGDQCHAAGPLDEKNRRLVKLGIAIGAGLEGAVHSAVRNALAACVSKEEIVHAALLAITTIGFPASMRALTWISDYVEPEPDRTESP